MSLYCITGASGSGKSTVLRELQARGYEAHGVDEDGYANWIDRKTGKITPYPGDENFELHSWYIDHEWTLDAEKVAELRQQADAQSKDVFLCGVADGQEKAWNSFNAVFALIIDEATIRQRVADRTDNDFGKTPDELNIILEWNKTSTETHKQVDALLIDASRPVADVVNQIVKSIETIK